MSLIESSSSGAGSRRALVYVVALLLLLNAGARLMRLHSDSPSIYQVDFRNVAPYKDEGEKAYEARNKALFGRWKVHHLDEFEYWMQRAPLWTWFLYFWFKAFGVSYASLRVMSILCAIVTLATGSVMLARHGSRTGAMLFPLVLGMNFFYLIFTRLGMMESMLIAWCALASAFMAESRRRPSFLLPASALLIVAFFVKKSALLLAPLWAGFLVLVLWQSMPWKGDRKAWSGALTVLAAAGLVVLAAVIARYQGVALLSHVKHAFKLTGEADHSRLLDRLGLLLVAMSPERIWSNYLVLLPSASILGSGWILHMAFRAVKRKRIGDLEWMALAWFLIARLAASASPHEVIRFHLYYFFPLCMMAAMAADRLWKNTGQAGVSDGQVPRSPLHKFIAPFRTRFVTRALLMALLAHELVMTGAPYWDWMQSPVYSIVPASRELGKTLEAEEQRTGRRPVVIGEWAGPLSLENDMVCHYVKANYNQDATKLAAFGITHLIENTSKYDPAAGRFKKLFPAAYERRKKVAGFMVRRRYLVLWRVPRYYGRFYYR